MAWSFVKVVDVTGDGFVDLVVSRPANTVAEAALFVNDGSGGFALNDSAIPLISGVNDGYVFGQVEAVDIEGDGDVDLIVPVFSTQDFLSDQPNVLLINGGSGSFTRDYQRTSANLR